MNAPYFPLYVNETLAELSCLSNEEGGAFLRLLLHSWKQEPVGTLPNDDDLLARFAGVSVTKWQELKPMVLSGFKMGNDGRWSHTSLRASYEKMRRYSKSRQDNAKKGKKGKSKAHAEDMQSISKACAEDMQACAEHSHPISFAYSDKETLSSAHARDPDVFVRAVDIFANEYGHPPHLDGQEKIRVYVSDLDLWKRTIERAHANKTPAKNVGTIVEMYREAAERKLKLAATLQTRTRGKTTAGEDDLTSLSQEELQKRFSQLSEAELEEMLGPNWREFMEADE